MRALCLIALATAATGSSGLPGPDFLHIDGLAFPTGPASTRHHASRHLALLANSFLSTIPNRSSPTEMLVGTKTSFPFSVPVDANSSNGGRFVTTSAGPYLYTGYSWELWDR